MQQTQATQTTIATRQRRYVHGPYGENEDIWYLHIVVNASYFLHSSDFATLEEACTVAVQLRDLLRTVPNERVEIAAGYVNWMLHAQRDRRCYVDVRRTYQVCALVKFGCACDYDGECIAVLEQELEKSMAVGRHVVCKTVSHTDFWRAMHMWNVEKRVFYDGAECAACKPAIVTAVNNVSV
jgi:hypothetical protein